MTFGFIHIKQCCVADSSWKVCGNIEDHGAPLWGEGLCDKQGLQQLASRNILSHQCWFYVQEILCKEGQGDCLVYMFKFRVKVYYFIVLQLYLIFHRLFIKLFIRWCFHFFLWWSGASKIRTSLYVIVNCLKGKCVRALFLWVKKSIMLLLRILFSLFTVLFWVHGQNWMKTHALKIIGYWWQVQFLFNLI